MAAAVRLLLLVARWAVAGAIAPPLGSTVGTIDGTSIEIPGPGFPGTTAGASNAAFPSGQQPMRLRYWPQLHFGLANRTLLGCWKTKVLHDTNSGWPGLCVNLAKQIQVTDIGACQNFCVQEPRCPVWQFNNQTTPGQCWVGFGTDCGDRRGGTAHGITVQGAQRIMHGEIHVLMSLRGWKINHLYQIGQFSVGNQSLNVDRCKAWCYSTIGCQFWQYSAAGGGCFVDAPMFSTQQNSHPHQVTQYPLTTTGGAHRDASFTEGEYIVHYCPLQTPAATPAPIQPAPAVVAPKGDGGNGFFTTWLIGGFLLLVGGVGYYFYQQQQQSKQEKRSSRQVSTGHGEYDNYESSTTYEAQEDMKPLMRPPVTPDSYSDGRYGGGPQGRPGGQQYGQQPGQYGQQPPGYRPQGNSFQPQQQLPPTTYGPGLGRGAGGGGMPPPTQLVDFGQGGGGYRQGASNMAPTQLLNQGMPVPGGGYR